jgi:hypothetical protein
MPEPETVLPPVFAVELRMGGMSREDAELAADSLGEWLSHHRTDWLHDSGNVSWGTREQHRGIDQAQRFQAVEQALKIIRVIFANKAGTEDQRDAEATQVLRDLFLDGWNAGRYA